MAWIDAGNGSNAQLAIVLGIVREFTIGNRHALPHDVLHTAPPIIILWGIAESLHLQSCVDIVVGLCPARHALICETVLQLIMVKHIGRGLSLDSVRGTKTFRHHKHHGHVLSAACQALETGNHLGDIRLDASGFQLVVDGDSIYPLLIHEHRDILQTYLEAIDHFPFAIALLLRLVHQPPRAIAARDSEILRDIALVTQQFNSYLFASLRRHIAHIHLYILMFPVDSHLVLILAEDGCHMYGVMVIVRYFNGDECVRRGAVFSGNILKFHIQKFVTCIRNDFELDRFQRHIPDHIGVRFGCFFYTIYRFQFATCCLMNLQYAQRDKVSPYLHLGGRHRERKRLFFIGTVVRVGTGILSHLGQSVFALLVFHAEVSAL